MLFGAILGCFGVRVGDLGGLSWRFGSLFGVHVGSCRAQMGVWQAQRPQGRGLEELGLAQECWEPGSGPNMGPTGAKLEPTWGQHGPNLSQHGAKLEPTWAQVGPRLAQVSQLGAIWSFSWVRLGPLLASSWTIMGLSWTRLAPIWTILGAPWSLLGALRAPLGLLRILASIWSLLGGRPS